MRSEPRSSRSAAYQVTNENEPVENPVKEPRRKKLGKMIQNYRNKTKAKAKRIRERAKRLKPRLRRKKRNQDRRHDDRNRREDRRQDRERDYYREESNDSFGYEEPSDIWMAENYLKQWREAQEDNEARKNLAMNWRRSQLTKSLTNNRRASNF